MNRRDVLRMIGSGFGTLGLMNTLNAEQPANLLLPRGPHFAPRAKRVIFLFLNGGLSQVDTFDPKPALKRFDGQPLPGPKIQTDRAAGHLMASPWTFRRCGQSGIEVSDIFPKVGESIDDFSVSTKPLARRTLMRGVRGER